eukprot:CAMPEP_0181364708 /NCGR_PEP_ID=MMETSP1106-20121128/9582_1 /TAXON_ID=81844 /ORGANISM="Mantoniella antarctica, Strain SL-175" /LENGTH=51 /DNA_ID=CAMNT_0023479543 /DNA_START=129 /DNA_END=281 /DNA_ORIENTATION=-
MAKVIETTKLISLFCTVFATWKHSEAFGSSLFSLFGSSPFSLFGSSLFSLF